MPVCAGPPVNADPVAPAWKYARPFAQFAGIAARLSGPKRDARRIIDAFAVNNAAHGADLRAHHERWRTELSLDDQDPKRRDLERALEDYLRLKEENAALRRLLVEHGITIPAQPKHGLSPEARPDAQDAGVDEHAGKDAKIALFRGLFRGREDVYALRMRFKSGEWAMPQSLSATGRRSFPQT